MITVVFELVLLIIMRIKFPKRINNLKNTQRVKEDLQGIKEGLRGTLYLLEFSYICSLFLLANDKSISHQNNKIF